MTMDELPDEYIVAAAKGTLAERYSASIILATSADEGWEGDLARSILAHARTIAEKEEAEAREAENKNALAMAVAEMSRARGRLETIATCNEDRRIAASLGSTIDHIRRVAFTALQENPDG